jgi:hypothetical protein
VWEIEYTDEFEEWWRDLTIEQQAALAVRVELLAERSPSLGRPAVERMHSSRHQNMKELRASGGGALRVLFMFNPRRQAILLLGGDKTGQWESCDELAVPIARRLVRRV